MSRKRRCAVYTRKSSEEGLDRDFNSLDAQREACEAYIKSQKHEGWRAVKDSFDDGGYSGGNMDRPGLQHLIEAIKKRHVTTVVVYKVDRLTRSLSDFAKLIDIFDEHEVSFVSVTQQFNTTTSMGRLTLNMLLSFAQFEREVTGERIRDKFAASKAKGMWMGGRPPLGYDIQNRKLIVNQAEAELVNHIYERYLALGSVKRLAEELEQEGQQSKQWITQDGKLIEGSTFRRGALTTILQNPIYIGKVRHKDQKYPGEHDAIISEELWRKVQERYERNRVARRRRSNAKSPSLLGGLIYETTGKRMHPSHANKKGKRYYYYIGDELRIPAGEVDTIVIDEINRLLTDRSELIRLLEVTNATVIERSLKKAMRFAHELKSNSSPAMLQGWVSGVYVGPSVLAIDIDKSELRLLLDLPLDSTPQVDDEENSTHRIERRMRIKYSSQGKRLILPKAGLCETTRADPILLRTLARAHAWLDELKSGKSFKDIADDEHIDQRLVARTVRLAFLAPEIVEAILDGEIPAAVTADRLLKRQRLPHEWAVQRSEILDIPVN